MMNNRNIICMSSTEWGGNYIKATVELMKVFAQSNKLLFVNSPNTVSEVVNHLRGKKKINLKRSLGLGSRLEKIDLPDGGTVNLLTPPVGLTINFLPQGPLYNKLLEFNAWLVRHSTKKALRKLGMQQDLIHIVAFNPGMGLFNGRKYGEKSLIYHCYDEMKGGDAWLRKHNVALEEAFLKMADGVIVTSKNLYKSKSPLNKRCYVVNNAANYDLFSQGFHQGIIGQPVIGYIGSVDHRIDYDIMEHLIANMPEAKFVFVGRIMNQRGAAVLKKFPNVELVGAKVPAELPAYLKTFSAGIIPFINDTLTNCIYPLKVNEYLAAGLPVISTDFGDMSDFREIVSIVKSGDKAGFLEATRKEIADDSAERRMARQQVASGNTWRNRAAEMAKAIEQIEQAVAAG